MYEDVELIRKNAKELSSDREGFSVGSIIRYHLMKQDIRFSEQQARGNNQVMPLPHQIEAVYSRMLAHAQVRYLLV